VRFGWQSHQDEQSEDAAILFYTEAMGIPEPQVQGKSGIVTGSAFAMTAEKRNA